jgi:hypothetical protein
MNYLYLKVSMSNPNLHRPSTATSIDDEEHSNVTKQEITRALMLHPFCLVRVDSKSCTQV